MEIILQIIGIARARYKALFLVFILVFTAVVAAAYIRKENFESTAQLMIKLDQRSVSISQSDVYYSLAHLQAVEAITSQAEILGANTLLEGLVDKLGPEVLAPKAKSSNPFIAYVQTIITYAKDSFSSLLIQLKLKTEVNQRYALVKKIRKNLKIYPVRKAQIIVLTYRDKIQDLPQKVLETLIELYRKKTKSLQENEADYAFYSSQAQELRKKLEIAENELAAFKISYKITDLETEKRLLLDKRSRIIMLLDGYTSGSSSSNTSTIASASSPQLLQLQTQLNSLRTEKSRLLITYDLSHKRIQEINNQIALVKDFIGKEKGSLREQAKANDKRLAALTRIDPQYKKHMREVKIWQEAYDVYGKASEDRKLANKRRERVNIHIVDPPSYPAEPINPTRLLIIAIGFCFAWFFAIIVVFIMEWVSLFKKPSPVSTDVHQETPGSIEECTSPQ